MTNKNVMVISIAYRLGVYGFLPVNPEVFETQGGNFGLIDQQNALIWGNKFAPHFGGDIEKATLVGASAGGEAALYHSMIPE